MTADNPMSMPYAEWIVAQMKHGPDVATLHVENHRRNAIDTHHQVATHSQTTMLLDAALELGVDTAIRASGGSPQLAIADLLMLLGEALQINRAMAQQLGAI